MTSAAMTKGASEPLPLPGPLAASYPAQFFQSAWGKTLGVLGAIAMLLGIYIEGVSIWTGVSEAEVARWTARYSDVKQKADAEATKFKAQLGQATATYAELRASAEAKTASYKADIGKYEASNAAERQRAEQELAAARARVARAKADVQERLARAQAELTEAQAEYTQLSAEVSDYNNRFLFQH